MDPRLRVERRAVERVDSERGPLERQALAEGQLLILERLDAEERHSEEQRGQEEDAQLSLIASLGGGEPLDHREAAANQYEGVQAGEGDVEDFPRLSPRSLERVPGCRGAESQGPGGSDDRGEEHDLGRQ